MRTQQEIEGADRQGIAKAKSQKVRDCYVGGRSLLQPVSTLLSGSCGFSMATVVPIVFT